MNEVAVSVAAKVAEYLVAPLTLPFRYFWNYKSNVKNLENEVKKLEGRRGSVHRSVEDARRNGEEIEKNVETWLDGVNNIIDEAWEFINEDKHQQANMKGCKGLSCTNLKKRYQHSKKAARLKADVGVQEQTGKFEKVSFRTIPEETWLQSSNAYKAFEARKSILMNIIDALRNPDVNVVGIYGMGGIGKTTLAKEVARKGKKGKLFREIVFVEVSQTPDIEKIQQEVADKLGLEFREESIPGRARSLCARLKKEEKILLILDNIWGNVNFEMVGIPFNNEHKGLKLLLTTRSCNVLTNEMDCQHNFRIESLNEVDAWSLFKSMVGTGADRADRPDLQPIALNVAGRCGGVPIAIVTIAKALRNKEIYEWNNTLRELRNPSKKGFEGVGKEVYTCIKLSYNYLESEELKAMFLLCSCMGRTYDASIQDLLRYGIGMSFFKDIDTMDQALDKVRTLVSKLKASSLLLDAPKSERYTMHDIPKSERFAMHDVVCVVARSITSRDHHVYVVIDDVIPRSWVYEDTLKNCTAITLHDVELPKHIELVCLQLKFLYMKPRDSFSQIPDNFFVWMLRLQVLHLIEMELRPLPISFGHLVDLRTLCLEKCKLGDIATIGNFRKLEILSFHHCKFNKLPEEIRQLTSVRLLDLRGHSNLHVIPPSNFSSLTQLEALYLDFDVRYQPKRPIIEGGNAYIDELKHLSYLTTLEINIPNDKPLKVLLPQKLESYKISIGLSFRNRYVFRHSTSRMLKISNLKINELDEIISQLKGIQDLELVDVLGLRNVVHDLNREGFSELKHLIVQNNSYCLCIIDSNKSVSCDALPILKSLFLRELINLEKICYGQLGVGSFQQLRTITVSGCKKLDNIFTCSTDGVLPNLEEILVSGCENMEAIFAVGGKPAVNNIEATDKLQLNQLRIVELRSLPQLKSFSSKVKTASPSQLTSDKKAQEIISDNKFDISALLFSEKVAIPNLEMLEVYKINVEKIWHNQFHIQNLRRLVIGGCVYLKEIFSASMITSFVKLQCLEIFNCSLLEEVVVTEDSRQDEDKDMVVFPQLNSLYIYRLVNLRRLHSGNYIKFPSLKGMKIENCPKLVEFLFDDKVGFPNLEEMKIAYMDNLKMIWHNQLADYSFSKLRSLLIYDCKELLTVLPSNVFERFLRLKSLIVQGCVSLEEIFDIPVKERHSMVATQLRKLHIYRLPNLKHVWNKDPQGKFSFENLRKLTVSKCQSLKNLFPASVAMGLSNLEYLSVSECGLENIVTKEGVVLKEEAPARFLFPKLDFLKLYDLPKLRSFYPGRHTIVGSALKKLKLCNCGEVKIFTSEVVSIHEISEEGQIDIPMQPAFLVEEAFPYLEELKLVGETVTIMWQGQVPKGLFYKLKTLVVKNDESSVLPLNIIQSFHNLEKLSLSFSLYKEIFSNEEVQTQAETVANVKKLVLFRLKNLKYMWKQEIKLDLIFQNLEVLDVYACNSLINLLPPSASFQNLSVLEVSNCNSLINIMTSSTARSLVQLVQMKIEYCETIAEVVGNQRDATVDKIIFSKLKSLSLSWLASLTSFCSWNCTLEFPALEELAVNYCDKMKVFTEGVLSTPTLREATIDRVWHDLSWNIDLNTVITQSYERKNKICTSIDNIASSSS